MSVLPGLRTWLLSAVSRAEPHDDVTPLGRTTPAAASVRVQRALLWQTAGMWLATRLVFVLFTYFAILFEAQPRGGRLNLTRFPPHVLLAAWNRWDANWYIQIATNGYAAPHGDLHRLGFFPLYPFLTHVVSLLIGQDHVLTAALIVSNLATLAGFCGLALLAFDIFGSRTAIYAVTIAAAYPLAFFTAAPYSDSLLLALAAFSILFARRGRWEWAAACAFVAGFDRLLALVLVLPLLWEFARQHYRPGMPLRAALTARAAVQAVLLAAAVPLALLLWSLYLGVSFGHPLGYMTAQNTYWGHESFAPWDGVRLAYDSVVNAPPWSYVRARVLVDVAPVAGFALVAILAVRRLPVSLSVYMGVLLFLLLSSGVPQDYDPLNGEGRYLIIAFPVFLILGRWAQSRPPLAMLLTAGGFMFQGLLTAYFLRGGWIV